MAFDMFSRIIFLRLYPPSFLSPPEFWSLKALSGAGASFFTAAFVSHLAEAYIDIFKVQKFWVLFFCVGFFFLSFFFSARVLISRTFHFSTWVGIGCLLSHGSAELYSHWRYENLAHRAAV